CALVTPGPSARRALAPRDPLFPYTTLFRSLDPPCDYRRVHQVPLLSRCAAPSRHLLGTIHRFRLVRGWVRAESAGCEEPLTSTPDRKSTRLNSSHVKISYPGFCVNQKNEPD